MKPKKFTRGERLTGACWYKPSEKFLAQRWNPFTKKNEYLGLFTCEQEAHNAWAKRKLELAHELAAIQEDPRVAKALIERPTRAPSGHRCGSSHQRAKLTTDQVKEMRAIREATGASYAALADKFGCGESTARDIVNYWTRVSS